MECGRLDCFGWKSDNPGGCEKNGSGYRITCEGCKSSNIVAEYEGETGRNTYCRGLEHQADLRTMKEDSPLWKHCVVEHSNEKQVRILSSKAQTLMNSRSEFHQAPILRVTISRGLELEQGEVHSHQGWRQGRGSRGGGGGRGARGRFANPDIITLWTLKLKMFFKLFLQIRLC